MTSVLIYEVHAEDILMTKKRFKVFRPECRASSEIELEMNCMWMSTYPFFNQFSISVP